MRIFNQKGCQPELVGWQTFQKRLISRLLLVLRRTAMLFEPSFLSNASALRNTRKTLRYWAQLTNTVVFASPHLNKAHYFLHSWRRFCLRSITLLVVEEVVLAVLLTTWVLTLSYAAQFSSYLHEMINHSAFGIYSATHHLAVWEIGISASKGQAFIHTVWVMQVEGFRCDAKSYINIIWSPPFEGSLSSEILIQGSDKLSKSKAAR